ncbi:MAG: pyruvate kinase [Oligoflexales bacterium]
MLDGTPIIKGMRAFRDRDSHIRHCKIIGTLGPASSNEETLSQLIEAGLNIVRLNFSHGDHATHAKNIELVRMLSKKHARHVTILQDLQGPKIRCGKLRNDQMVLQKNEIHTLKFGHEQTDDTIPIDYRDIVQDVAVGDRVMMDDGLLILEVTGSKQKTLQVKVLEGGLLKSRKGVNFPDSHLSLPALTEKDTKDLLFGIAQRVDVVALSFVQSPDDLTVCRKIIQALGADTPIIAKIEKISAVNDIDKIAKVADGLMVARGDLGVECQVEKVPSFQRLIVNAAAQEAIPVIIATQMLESMVENPRASLAELADVANGVLEGADAIMLSAEVAAGRFPVECVKRMVEVIEQVESWAHTRTRRYSNTEIDSKWETHEAIARSTCEAADELNARAIVCLTLTGSIARQISRWRPHTPIIAISPREEVIHRLELIWGVYGMRNPLFYNTDVLLQDLPHLLKSLGIVQSGDTIVITAGIPINSMNPTNMIKINTIP